MPQLFRRGMTLIELLIVIVILATLTAAALPLLTPSTMERRLREASRGLNMYIAQAQAKAVSTQRPYGVALKRLSAETGNAGDAGVCLEVISVEQPVPYAGFDENSRVRVAINSSTFGTYAAYQTVRIEFVARDSTAANSSVLPPGWRADLLPNLLLREGDVVEVMGTRYQLSGEAGRVDAATGYLIGNTGSPTNIVQLIGIPLNSTGQALKPVYANDGTRLTPALLQMGNAAPYWTEPAPYKIYRQPVPASGDPYQMPEGSAIDLEVSGIMGELPFQAGANVISPVYIMFSPEGSIERVQYSRVLNAENLSLGVDNTPVTPSSSVSLLVGRRELIPADQTLNLEGGSETENELEKAKLNHLNLESRWVSIGASTGAVVTTENARVRLPVTTVNFDGNGDTEMNRRRTQITAAQEFARGMRRIGGG
ncbi:pilus assembly FimT family protein [Aeoliella sp. SH292]|uniref:pilus assembly FimT family protein n=1 Tax=Aeoliella sp. SH292 TaxID=3454464 RepID=UPI003F9845E5